MTPATFINQLSAISFENVFNPYSDRCALYDTKQAPKIRAQALLAILEIAVETDVDALWLGRDLGYRGGRRTGLALTDDVHLSDHSDRWGLEAKRPTVGEEIAERTAAVIWGVLNEVSQPVFLWNVFPFHPHEEGDPFSNRSHNSRERKVGEDILAELIDLLHPRRVIAVGNDAARIEAGDLPVVHVRHPSYGGQTIFCKQIREIYELPQLAR